MRIDHREKDRENHDRGLDYDLPRLLHRRGMLKLVAGAGLAGAGLVTLGACADDTSTAGTTSSKVASQPGRPAEGQVPARPSPPKPATPRMGRFQRRPRVRIRATVPTVRMC
jgi:hypothetical protein